MRLLGEKDFSNFLVDFMKTNLIGSVGLSKLLIIPKEPEEKFDQILKNSKNGIYLGSSSIMSKPFFLDFENLINPHIFVVGMTGSGKTFMVKNLMLKLFGCLNSTIFLLDFTGEYSSFANFINAKNFSKVSFKNSSEKNENSIFYLNLEKLDEKQKIITATQNISFLVEIMRSRKIGSKNKFFIIIDEAWKVLDEHSEINTLIREGRKYSVGVILSSQIIEDVDQKILSNFASLFVFRTQNMKTLEKLKINYQIPLDYVEKIQNLNVGNCIAIMVYNSDKRGIFEINKIIGVNIAKKINLSMGNNMIEIKKDKIEKLIHKVSKDDPSNLILKLEMNNTIDLNVLILELLKLNADRLELLSGLLGLGLDHNKIADSFAIALNGVTYVI